VRIAVVPIVTRGGPLSFRAHLVARLLAGGERVMLVGAVRRGSRVHGVVLAPGGRRVEVRIVIHLDKRKTSVRRFGRRRRTRRARGRRARRRPSARASPVERGRSRGRVSGDASRRAVRWRLLVSVCARSAAAILPSSKPRSAAGRRLDASGASGGICDAFFRCALFFGSFACIFGISAKKKVTSRCGGSWFVIPRVGHLSGCVAILILRLTED